MRKTCQQCDFWNPWVGAKPTDAPSAAQCRRHAPGVLIHPENDVMGANAIWPLTNPDYWCGDYQPISADTLEARRVEKEAFDNNPFGKL